MKSQQPSQSEGSVEDFVFQSFLSELQKVVFGHVLTPDEQERIEALQRRADDVGLEAFTEPELREMGDLLRKLEGLPPRDDTWDAYHDASCRRRAAFLARDEAGVAAALADEKAAYRQAVDRGRRASEAG